MVVLWPLRPSDKMLDVNLHLVYDWKQVKKTFHEMNSFWWCPKSVITVRTWKCVFECYLKREQSKFIDQQNCDICDGVYFFAIFHFWRRKFDCNPVATLPIKSNSEVTKMFTRLDIIQNRLNMKSARKLYSLLGLLTKYIMRN